MTQNTDVFLALGSAAAIGAIAITSKYVSAKRSQVSVPEDKVAQMARAPEGICNSARASRTVSAKAAKTEPSGDSFFDDLFGGLDPEAEAMLKKNTPSKLDPRTIYKNINEVTASPLESRQKNLGVSVLTPGRCGTDSTSKPVVSGNIPFYVTPEMEFQMEAQNSA